MKKPTKKEVENVLNFLYEKCQGDAFGIVIADKFGLKKGDGKVKVYGWLPELLNDLESNGFEFAKQKLKTENETSIQFNENSKAFVKFTAYRNGNLDVSNVVADNSGRNELHIHIDSDQSIELYEFLKFHLK